MIIKKVETQPPIGSLTTDVLKVTLENDNIIYVPNDEANKDYQAIQKWIANGGTIIDNGGGE
tara:strand:- start:714 stop:899 length:186 start_codon:yes stop_codon:yes gene_type:complete